MSRREACSAFFQKEFLSDREIKCARSTQE